MFYRCVGEKDLRVYKKYGKFPPSEVIVFCDNEVLEIEGYYDRYTDEKIEELCQEYSGRRWLNVTRDLENAKGYGSVCIWVDDSIVYETDLGRYGVVSVDDIVEETRGVLWDFV